uniref:Uncharacterized protein n=1 Tax=Cucumis melo TaxID=3656 RepID=A0A9I9D8R9_CUCME
MSVPGVPVPLDNTKVFDVHSARNLENKGGVRCEAKRLLRSASEEGYATLENRKLKTKPLTESRACPNHSGQICNGEAIAPLHTRLKEF